LESGGTCGRFAMCASRHRTASFLVILTVVFSGSLTMAARPAGEETHCEDMVVTGDKILVERDEVVNGDVVCICGDIEIAGTVKGDAVSICGDLVLKRTAVVEGDVVAVGGKIEKHKEAKVHGESMSIGIRLNRDEGGCDARSSI